MKFLVCAHDDHWHVGRYEVKGNPLQFGFHAHWHEVARTTSREAAEAAKRLMEMP